MTNDHRMIWNQAVHEATNGLIEEHEADPWLENLLSEIFPVSVHISKDSCYAVPFLCFISAIVTVTHQNVRQNIDSSLGKNITNTCAFDMKNLLMKSCLFTLMWHFLCCSTCDDASSWLLAVCPKDDIVFIQVVYPQGTHSSKGPSEICRMCSHASTYYNGSICCKVPQSPKQGKAVLKTILQRAAPGKNCRKCCFYLILSFSFSFSPHCPNTKYQSGIEQASNYFLTRVLFEAMVSKLVCSVESPRELLKKNADFQPQRFWFSKIQLREVLSLPSYYENLVIQKFVKIQGKESLIVTIL